MPLDLSDADLSTLAALIRETIAADRFPLSPRIKRLRAILAKLEPPPPAAGSGAGAVSGREAAG